MKKFPSSRDRRGVIVAIVRAADALVLAVIPNHHRESVQLNKVRREFFSALLLCQSRD